VLLAKCFSKWTRSMRSSPMGGITWLGVVLFIPGFLSGQRSNESLDTLTNVQRHVNRVYTYACNAFKTHTI
jgi:hypothetical protein